MSIRSIATFSTYHLGSSSCPPSHFVLVRRTIRQMLALTAVLLCLCSTRFSQPASVVYFHSSLVFTDSLCCPVVDLSFFFSLFRFSQELTSNLAVWGSRCGEDVYRCTSPSTYASSSCFVQVTKSFTKKVKKMMGFDASNPNYRKGSSEIHNSLV